MAGKEKSGKGKIILLAVIAVLLLLIAAGGAWWFLLRSTAAPSKAQLQEQRAQRTKFIDLGELVTNLQSTDGGTHYIQVKVELKTYDADLDKKIQTYLPEIRNQVLQLLAAQQAEKVSDPAVRTQLLDKIKADVNQILETDGGALSGPVNRKNSPIVAAYFSSFVVQ
ncbi:flagellar basal body-associated FliL family protein [Acidithiobacillus sp. AMEEHan]|uniref:flagellar basal body-associated FliL family protein n=1 Tax=Acidithiobacillus sp. AMEEHan TaxID=2994951 RepID=UPI0027E4E31C|nr:flagellar basal body-associated FliL family protein [Acidithiobacillus sp. AMEEHan]